MVNLKKHFGVGCRKDRHSRNFDLMKQAKENMGVGTATMTGNLVMGNIAASPGFPAAGLAGMTTAMGANNLVNVGSMAKTGMGLTSMFGSSSKKKKK